jgi:hypothetical protein
MRSLKYKLGVFDPTEMGIAPIRMENRRIEKCRSARLAFMIPAIPRAAISAPTAAPRIVVRGSIPSIEIRFSRRRFFQGNCFFCFVGSVSAPLLPGPLADSLLAREKTRLAWAGHALNMGLGLLGSEVLFRPINEILSSRTLIRKVSV